MIIPMRGTRITGELLSAARQRHAKVILVGYDRQLAVIERGGLFRELALRYGAAEHRLEGGGVRGLPARLCRDDLQGHGRTIDHIYLYHTGHWRSAASYVALTRQRESAQVFVARETARETSALARQMARGDNKSASLAWATREEFSAARGALQGRGAAGEREARGAGLSAASEAVERRRERQLRAALRSRETEARVGGAGMSQEGGAAAGQGRRRRRNRAPLPQVGSMWSGRAMTFEDAARLGRRPMRRRPTRPRSAGSTPRRQGRRSSAASATTAVLAKRASGAGTAWACCAR